MSSPEKTMRQEGSGVEAAVWVALRTVYDPEIPVNIVDLGLIYSCCVVPCGTGQRVEVAMTLTAPGCAMSEVIKKEVEGKLAQIPGVSEVSVAVVFDPPWDKSRMSEEAKLQLGFDLDAGVDRSSLPIWNRGK